MNGTGPRSTVGKVSGGRRLLAAKSSALSLSSDRPILKWRLLIMNQEGLLSFTSESVCTKYWLTALSSLSMKSVVR